MQELDPKQLMNVVGGAILARRSTNRQVELAVTKMASDLRYAERQRRQQIRPAAAMMMAAVMARSQMA